MTEPISEEEEFEFALALERENKASGPAESPPSLLPSAVDQESQVPVTSGLKHAAGGFGQAARDVVDLPWNIIPEVSEVANDYLGWLPQTYAARHLTGAVASALKDKTPPSQLPYSREAFDAISAEQPDVPEGSFWDIARTGAEWGAGGLVNAPRKAVSVVPDVMAAGGAMVGQALGGDVGEVAGGITGVLSSAFRPRSVTGDITPSQKDAAEKLQSVDPNAYDRVLRSTGQEGTVAERARSQPLTDIEVTLSRSDPVFGRELEGQYSARSSSLEDEAMIPFRRGRAGLDRSVAKERVGTIEDKIDARTMTRTDNRSKGDIAELEAGEELSNISAAKAIAALDESKRALSASEEAGAPLRSTERPAESATRAQEQVSEAAKLFRSEKETPAWEAYKKQPPFSQEPFYSAIEDYLNGMNKIDRTAFNEAFKNPLRFLDKKDATIAPDDIQRLLSKMKKDASNARFKDDGPDNETITHMDNLIARVEGSIPDPDGLHSAAKKQTIEYYRRFGDDAVQKAISDDPEKFWMNIGTTDEMGARGARLLNETELPGAPSMIFDQLAAMASREGGISRGFIERNADMMASLPPEQQALINNAAEAREYAERAMRDAEISGKRDASVQKGVESRERQLNRALDASAKNARREGERLKSAVGKSNLSKFAKSPDRTIKALLNRDGAEDLGVLFRQVSRDGGGDAFKARAGDALKEKLLSGDREARQVLVDSGILTKQEADNIERIANDLQSVEMRKKAINTILGNPQGESNIVDAMRTGAAVVVGRATPGSDLFTIPLARRIIKRMTENAVNPEELRAIEEMMLNPEKYLSTISEARNSEEVINSVLTGVVAAGQATSEDEENGKR